MEISKGLNPLNPLLSLSGRDTGGANVSDTSNMALELFKIFCILESEKDDRGRAFSVKIAKTDDVYDLKKAIISENSALANYDASSIVLSRVDVLSDSDFKENIRSATQTELATQTQELVEIFPNGTQKNTVHIIVQHPTEPTSRSIAPVTRSLVVTDEVIKEKIAVFQPRLEMAIKTFLENNTELPLWEPEVCSDEIRDHIARLKIPKIFGSQAPSLLLHDLGQLPPKGLAKRVETLFDLRYSQRFFCNTSGSGKTRLILEGLCLNWGLYFTARTKPEHVGSSDLEGVLELLDTGPRLTPLTEQSRDTAHAANREVTSRRFLLLQYVRLLVFRVFLECASALPGGIVHEHKRRWLLVQLAPDTLLGADFFNILTKTLKRASLDYLEAEVSLELLKVTGLLSIQPAELFCVLDEAQIPTNMFSDYFLSETEPMKPRPILRQLVKLWMETTPNLIVSGTGISMEEMETVIGSVAAKQASFPTLTFMDTGAFDDARSQRAYLKKYLPTGYLNSEEGKVVASRARYWLHGRHRFTATYISLFLQAGLKSPNTVLNEYVRRMTNFRPSDHPDDGNLANTPKIFKLFDLSRLETNQPLLRQIAGCIFEYIFNGSPRDLGDPSDKKLVEFGIARFVGNRNIKADEPLALLAATHYFNTQTEWPWWHFLVDGLSTSNESARGIAFEQVGAYLLGLAFSSPTPLSEVFDFIGDNDLKNAKAQLVAIYKDKGGYIPRTIEDTLAWLNDPQHTIFCFPAKAVGPDLILVLKLPDETLLRVIIQFKTEKQLGPNKTENALRTTDPSQFTAEHRSHTQDAEQPPQAQKGKRKSASKSYVVDPDLNQAFLEALDSLGAGTEHAGRFGVLRVLASHPAIPDAGTLDRVADHDRSHHLMATVDLPSLAQRYSEKKILASLMGRTIASTRNRPQRNPGDELEDANSVDDSEGEDARSDDDTSSAHVDKKRRLQ